MSKYVSISEVAKRLKKSAQTINLWYKWSGIKEKEVYEKEISKGASIEKARELALEARYIPTAIKLGGRKTKHWLESDVSKIESFSNSIARGDLSRYRNMTRNKN